MSNANRGGAVAVAVLAVACQQPPAIAPRAAPREVFAAYQLGALRVEVAPPIDRTIEPQLAGDVAVRSARLLDISRDGTTLLTMADGECVEIAIANPLPAIRWSSDLDVDRARYGANRTIAVTADRDGDEQTGLFVTPGRAGDIDEISPARATDLMWAGERLVYGFATDELWIAELGGASRRIAGGGPWTPLDVSRDGAFLLARRERSSAESALYRIELATGVAVAVTGVGGVATPAGRFTPDGELIVVTDAGRDRLGLVAISGRAARRMASELPGDVTELAIASDGSLVFVTANDGVSTLRSLDLATGQHHAIAGGPQGGVISDLRAARDAPVIGFSFTSSTQPRAVYALDLRASRPLVRWPTDPRPGAIEPLHDAATASEGVTIPLLGYVPRSAGRHPVVIDLHGGPEDQWLPGYAGFVQFLVHRGYAVIRPNVRGSTGQGRAFAALDDGPRRRDVVRDVGAVLDWVRGRPDLASDRIVVMGTSYGGYLALASLARYPDRLRGGITLGAITDLVGFLEGTAAYRRDHRRAEYGDERDPTTRAMLAATSPVLALRRPLLIAHGARDPRVPIATSERFVRAARDHGSVVWSIVAADEGHVFERGVNRTAFEILVTQFLEQFARDLQRRVPFAP